MEAKSNDKTNNSVQLLDLVVKDPEIQKIQYILQEKKEVSIYGLYEGQRMLVSGLLSFHVK